MANLWQYFWLMFKSEAMEEEASLLEYCPIKETPLPPVNIKKPKAERKAKKRK